MSRLPLVAGNWKMNKTAGEAVALVEAMLPALLAVRDVEQVICPPAVALASVSQRLAGTPIRVGAQHIHWEPAGAFTGEISASMVREFCAYVIVGHSERRTLFGETDETVNRRVRAALGQALTPILCVGETLEEQEAGRTDEVVRRQVRRGLEGQDLEKATRIVVAYEPVWAIGTGRAATGEAADQVVRQVIRPALAAVLGSTAAESIRVLYGGSVTAANAGEFFGQPEIDGALVGGASLKVEEFPKIVAAARRQG